MLELKNFIAKGATRICFQHPKDENLCIKVVVRFKEIDVLSKELKVYNYIKQELKDCIVEYQNQLVDTNLGKGIVLSLLRDDDNSYSKTLNYYHKTNNIDKEIISELYHFAYKLIAHDIFFYDFNLNNFTIQIRNNKKKLYYTDLKSFESYKSWGYLKLEKIIPSLARHIMKKRLHKMFKSLNIK